MCPTATPSWAITQTLATPTRKRGRDREERVAFRPGPYPKQCHLLLPVPPPLASGGFEHLGCCTAESCCWAHNLWVLIIYLFFPLVILPSEIPRLTTDSAASVSWCLETSLFFKTSLDRSQSLPLLSLFLSFIFSPTSFRRQWATFLGVWCPLPAFRNCFVEFSQRSNVLSMNLWGRKWSPRPIPLPS